MKKLKKPLLVILCLLIVIVLVAAIVISTNLDKIVKTAVETVAPTITKTTVTLDSVSLSLFTGSAALNGLVIGNPPGYKTPFAISVGKAAVSLSPGSLLSDKIVVKSVEVRAPEISFEGNPLGVNNLGDILNNLKSAPTTNQPAVTASGKPAKKLQVDHLVITGAKVHASINGLNGLTSLVGINTNTFTITIPSIELNGLGQGPDGITATDLGKTILTQLSSATIKSVGDFAKTNLTSAANNILNGVKSSNTVDQIKKGLGGLLGK